MFTNRLGLVSMLLVPVLACADDSTVGDDTEQGGDGDGDGDGTGDGDGDGDGTGDGDGDGDGSGDGDGDGDGSGDGDGDGDGTGDGDGDGDGDGVVHEGEVPCDPDAEIPWAGALCGPADDACEVKASALIDTPYYRNGRPDVDVDADCNVHVLFARAEGGYVGGVASYVDESWDKTTTPFAFARGGITVDRVDQSVVVSADDGAFGSSVWRRSADEWTLIDELDFNAHMDDALGCDDAGVLHLAARKDSGEAVYASIEDDVLSIYESDYSATSTALAVEADGTPHLFALGSGGGSWQLHWGVDSFDAELAFDFQTAALGWDDQMYAVAAVGGEDIGTAFVLSPRGDDLMFAERAAANDWQTYLVDTGLDPDDESTICPWPTYDGETCDYDYVLNFPIGVATSEGGDARIVYSRIHRIGMLEAVCGGAAANNVPRPGCEWEVVEDDTSGELRIGWVDGQSVESEGFPTESLLVGGNVAVDGSGNLHVVASGISFGESDTTVHWFALGPVP